MLIFLINAISLNGENDKAIARCSVDEVSNPCKMKKDGKIWLSRLVEGDEWSILGK
jgi:hypothetical protein